MWDSDDYDRPSNWTDVAQICLNGDVINDSTKEQPQLSKKFCPKCGEQTITTCLNCNKNIAGEIHYSNVFGAHEFKRPSFCIECGKPYPWTTKKLAVVKELTSELKEISHEDKVTLNKSLEDITKDDTGAEVGAIRIKKIMSKVTGTAGEITQKVIVEIASETAKKILLGK